MVASGFSKVFRSGADELLEGAVRGGAKALKQVDTLVDDLVRKGYAPEVVAEAQSRWNAGDMTYVPPPKRNGSPNGHLIMGDSIREQTPGLQKGDIVEAAGKANDNQYIHKNPVFSNEEAVTLSPQKETVTVSPELKAIPAGKDISEEVAQAIKIRESAVGMKQRALAKGQNFSEDALSRLSTIGPIDSNQVKLWVKDAPKKAKAGVRREVGGNIFDESGNYLGEEVSGMPFVELHHEAMKAIYSSYVDQAWQLVDKGLATAADVVNLKYLASKLGFGLGDFGVKPYNRLAHQAGHSTTKKLGIELTGEALQTEVAKISKFSNITDLTKDFQKSLDTLAVPMRRHLDLNQRAYNKIPTRDTKKFFQLKNSKAALTKELRNAYKALTGKNLPDIPTAVKKNRTIVEWIKKKTNDPQIIALAERLQSVRTQGDELSKTIKGKLPKQIKEDVARDVDTLERWIDSQEAVGIDRGSDQYRLMLGSNEEAAGLRTAEALTGDQYSF